MLLLMQEKKQLCKQCYMLFLGSNGATGSSDVCFRISGFGKIELKDWLGICMNLGSHNMILTLPNHIDNNVAVKWVP